MGKRGVLLSVGLLLVVLGGYPLLYVYAFASMVPPHLEGREYWDFVLSKMFNSSGAGWLILFSAAVILGCVLFLWGIVVVIGDVFRYGKKAE